MDDFVEWSSILSQTESKFAFVCHLTTMMNNESLPRKRKCARRLRMIYSSNMEYQSSHETMPPNSFSVALVPVRQTFQRIRLPFFSHTSPTPAKGRWNKAELFAYWRNQKLCPKRKRCSIWPAAIIFLLVMIATTPVVNAETAMLKGSGSTSSVSFPSGQSQPGHPSEARQLQFRPNLPSPTHPPKEGTDDPPTRQGTDNPTEFPSSSPMPSLTVAPSSIPTDSAPPSILQETGIPTFMPTEELPVRQQTEPPTGITTEIPTESPTDPVITTESPSLSPPSRLPSDAPTVSETSIPSENPSTSFPTEGPSSFPTPLESASPSNFPTTLNPTNTLGPTTTPTFAPSIRPSTSFPTTTQSPTIPPSSFPTSTERPTAMPSEMPSETPSLSPSTFPSVEPTLATPSVGKSKFLQTFYIGDTRQFTDAELGLIEGLYVSYTREWVPSDDISKVKTTCLVENQSTITPLPTNERTLRGTPPPTIGYTNRRGLQDASPAVASLDLTYEMEYTSIYLNVTTFPLRFQDYVNSNLETVAQQMRILRVNVSSVDQTTRIVISTTSPTISTAPSLSPTNLPTGSPAPTGAMLPSERPSSEPSIMSDPSSAPSNVETPSVPPAPDPTSVPEVSPTPSPSSEDGGFNETTVIVVSVVVAGSILLIGALLAYNKRKRMRELEFRSNIGGNGRAGDPQGNQLENQPEEDKKSLPQTKSATIQETSTTLSALHPVGYAGNQHGSSLKAEQGILSPAESLVSNQSLLSQGIDLSGDSGDELDATQGLADEFDQYKDKNLEKMRADVEGSLQNFDGMMNQAMTIALFPDDDDENVDVAELMWGGSGGGITGLEIEASALGEVMEWLKRNEKATVEHKRTFMQELLNRMVTSVRHGILGPDDASRSIHECAALLGLQLATEIPVVTLIITGMSKKATASDLEDAFREFGEVSEVAVSSKKPDFGILRFKSVKSVDRAMNKFKNEEIVVQDVAVQVRILEPGGTTTAANVGMASAEESGALKRSRSGSNLVNLNQ